MSRALTVAALAWLAACGNREALPSAIDREIELARAAVVPPAARVVSEARTTANWSLAVRWELEVEQSWADYLRGVRSRLPSAYGEADTRDGAASWSRMTSGDSFSIRVQRRADGPPLRVVVVFTAVAT